MERAGSGITKTSGLRSPGEEPEGYTLIFHLTSKKCPPIKRDQLSGEEIGEINQALTRIDCCPSVQSVKDLNHRYYNDVIEKMAAGGIARLVHNYIEGRQVEQRKDRQPAAVAGGSLGGIANALVAARVVRLGTAVEMVAKGSRLMAIALGASGLAKFKDHGILIGTPFMIPYAEELAADLTGVDFSEPEITIVGGRGVVVATPDQMRQEIVGQLTTRSDRRLIEQTLKEYCNSRPHDIGLDKVGRNQLLAAAAAGVVVVLGAAAAAKYYKGRQES